MIHTETYVVSPWSRVFLNAGVLWLFGSYAKYNTHTIPVISLSDIRDILLVVQPCSIRRSKATNLDLCLAAITSRGYAVETFLIDAKTYGLPQNRRRIYILCWNTSNPSMAGSPKKFFDDVKVMMAAMRFDPPPVAAWRKIYSSSTD